MHWILSYSGSLVSPIKQEASTLIVFPADKKKKKNTPWFLCQGNPHKLGRVCKHLSSRREAEPHGRDTVRRCVLGWGRLGKARGAHAPVTPVPLVTVLGWNPGWGGGRNPLSPQSKAPPGQPPPPPAVPTSPPAARSERTKHAARQDFYKRNLYFSQNIFKKKPLLKGAQAT